MNIKRRARNPGPSLPTRNMLWMTRWLLSVFRHRCGDLFFHSVEVERRALLHGRIVDGAHGELCHYLLDKHEAPELVHEPVHIEIASSISVHTRETHFLERIQTQVDQNRHVRMILGTEPAAGLGNELVLVVV